MCDKSFSEPSPTVRPNIDHRGLIEITIKSVMQGSNEIVFKIRKTATIKELKNACQGRTDLKYEQLLLIFNGKELRNDQAHLADYDITKDCTIDLYPKMQAGVKDHQYGMDIVIILPTFFSNTKSATDLRQTVRGLHTSFPFRCKKDVTDTQKWTPEKQREHEKIRNRMKMLMKRRRGDQSSSSKKHCVKTDSESESSLNCSSTTRSPICSRDSISNSSIIEKQSVLVSGSSTPNSAISSNDPKEITDQSITQKELKSYYDPPESLQEMEFLRCEFHDPPQNEAELKEQKEKLKEHRKKHCKICRKHLRLDQSLIKCLCNASFCAIHRNPQTHQCPIDYKQTGRMQMEKENPKVGNEALHNAKC